MDIKGNGTSWVAMAMIFFTTSHSALWVKYYKKNLNQVGITEMTSVAIFVEMIWA